MSILAIEAVNDFLSIKQKYFWWLKSQKKKSFFYGGGVGGGRAKPAHLRPRPPIQRACGWLAKTLLRDIARRYRTGISHHHIAPRYGFFFLIGTVYFTVGRGFSPSPPPFPNSHRHHDNVRGRPQIALSFSTKHHCDLTFHVNFTSPILCWKPIFWLFTRSQVRPSRMSS